MHHARMRSCVTGARVNSLYRRRNLYLHYSGRIEIITLFTKYNMEWPENYQAIIYSGSPAPQFRRLRISMLVSRSQSEYKRRKSGLATRDYQYAALIHLIYPAVTKNEATKFQRPRAGIDPEINQSQKGCMDGLGSMHIMSIVWCQQNLNVGLAVCIYQSLKKLAEHQESVVINELVTLSNQSSQQNDAGMTTITWSSKNYQSKLS